MSSGAPCMYVCNEDALKNVQKNILKMATVPARSSRLGKTEQVTGKFLLRQTRGTGGREETEKMGMGEGEAYS